MFGWSHNEFNAASNSVNPHSRKIQELRTFYEDTDAFVIDKVNVMSATSLHETMTAIFNLEHKVTRKRICCHLVVRSWYFYKTPLNWDPLQELLFTMREIHLRSHRAPSRKAQQTAKGQALYKKYLVPNCMFFNQGQRNSRFLEYICDRISVSRYTGQGVGRSAKAVQQRQFPEVVTDYGIHYENEQCSMFNRWKLLADCSSSIPPCLLF